MPGYKKFPYRSEFPDSSETARNHQTLEARTLVGSVDRPLPLAGRRQPPSWRSGPKCPFRASRLRTTALRRRLAACASPRPFDGSATGGTTDSIGTGIPGTTRNEACAVPGLNGAYATPETARAGRLALLPSQEDRGRPWHGKGQRPSLRPSRKSRPRA